MHPEKSPLSLVEERILILMAIKDAMATAAILRNNGITPFICRSLAHVCEEMRLGAGGAILTEEMILSDSKHMLEKTLTDEPAWSDFPLLVLTPAGKDSPHSLKALDAIGHMTLVQRPVQISELVSAVRTALRNRRRQYDLRHYIAELSHQSEALRTSEEQFRQVANSIPQLAWMSDDKGWVFWFNQRWYDYTGFTQQEMEGRSWEHVHDPGELERVMLTWKASLASGEPWQEVFPLRRHDGQMRWHLTRALPITNMKGKVIRWFGTNTDITEQREAIDKANAANVAKTEFLANMSHEIRTPMNAVMGLSALLAASSPLTPKQKEFIKTLRMSADSLLALINDLLDIAKIENKSVELESIPFSLAGIIEEIIGMMSVKAREKGVCFVTDIRPVEGKEFIGDPTRIRQILTNLCSNAVKFTDKGQINLRIQSTSPDAAAVMNLSISVADTGIGIQESKLASVFDQFTQADSSINRKYGGTGLGLAITKTLVDLMKGRITVESEHGKGSVFTVFLPLPLNTQASIAQKPVKPPAPPSHAAQATDKPNILLVEDSKANILVTTTYLQQYGYLFDVAENGVQAIERYKSGSYEAILMDVQMHEMNGYQATQAIRIYEKEKGKRPVPIIGMTAHALADDKDKCIQAGMDDYISKPFQSEILQETLERYIYQRKVA